MNSITLTRTSFFSVLALFWTVNIGITLAQAGPSLPESLDQYMSSYVKADHFSGTVLVARDGRVLFDKAYGLADRALKEAATVDTPYLLASITKQFTATLVLREVEQGRLSLDDSVRTFIPDAPLSWKNITIRELLNHTSGIYDYLNGDDLELIRMLDLKPKQIIERFMSKPLEFAPGTSFKYCNSGFMLLGYILEQVTGMSYATLLKSEIFDPLGMKNSGVETLGSFPGGYAVGYTQDDHGKWIIPPFMHPSISFAVGDMYSTVGDLFLWARSFTTDLILSADTRRQMLTPGMKDYGYGVFISQTEGHREVWHTGHLTGHSNILSIFPDEGVAVIVLSNLRTTPVREIDDGLIHRVFSAR